MAAGDVERGFFAEAAAKAVARRTRTTAMTLDFTRGPSEGRSVAREDEAALQQKAYCFTGVSVAYGVFAQAIGQPFGSSMTLYRSSLPKQKRRPKPPLVRCDRYVASSHGDVRGLEPLGTLDHVELELRAFLQGAEAVGVDGAEVHEDILTSAGRDEAETLRVVEPLDRTVATHSENLLILCSCCTRGDSEALHLDPASHRLCNQQGSPLSHSIPIQMAPTTPAVGGPGGGRPVVTCLWEQSARPGQPPRRGLHQRILALDAMALVEHVLADVVHHPVELHVGLLHHPLQPEDDLDAGQVDAEVAREREDHLELADLIDAVQPSVACRAHGLEQTLALVQTQRLRMDVVPLGDDRDHHVSVCSAAAHDRDSPVDCSSYDNDGGAR